jgi:hypothetical protein
LLKPVPSCTWDNQIIKKIIINNLTRLHLTILCIGE